MFVIDWSWNGWFNQWCDLCGRWKKINGGMCKEWEIRIFRNVEFGEGKEHFVFPENDMMRDMQRFKDKILASISFVLYLIP